jgi:hypothetical protein
LSSREQGVHLESLAAARSSPGTPSLRLLFDPHRVEASDPLTGEIVPLFHPRQQQWGEHFAWSPEGDRILGLTPTGRATVAALHLNRDKLVEARQTWVAVGLHPPKD